MEVQKLGELSRLYEEIKANPNHVLKDRLQKLGWEIKAVADRVGLT